MNRQEHDSIGVMDIPQDAYYGINAKRARDNFKITELTLDTVFIKSLLEVKKATTLANLELAELDSTIGQAILSALDQMLAEDHFDDIIVDPIQGGAGTSINMNVNEVIANRAIELLGGQKGNYQIVSPNDHVNKGQSTNDVIPTAGKITFLKKIISLQKVLEALAATFLEKATLFSDVPKMGRTQLSDAVPITAGQEFYAYHMVTKRNIERLKEVKQEMVQVNIGGTAIGTRMSAHPEMSIHTIDNLNRLTGLSLVEAEDLIDNTQNIESFAVVSDCLKVIAVSMSKIANDIRLLSSGPRTGIGELIIPAKQNGSSIMPGKINPVIPEVVTQCAFLVVGNNVSISMAVEAGQLELNAFEPVIFYKMLESFKVLENSLKTFDYNCIQGIQVDKERCQELLEKSTYLSTPLAQYIGYEKASEIAKESLKTGLSVREIARNEGVSEDVLAEL